jgi:hypothetical protein
LALPLLLRDVEVHDVLGGILELAKLLLQTYISKQANLETRSLTSCDTSSHLATIDKTLTMTDLCGLLLDGHHLVLNLGQLFLEGALSLLGACIHSRLNTQQEEPTRYTEST